jgi:anti-sigma B factor antagonist
MFSLEVEKNGDVSVVRLSKHQVLDDLTVNTLGEELLGLADRPDCDRLLLDCSGAAQLSSALLGKLVTLHRKMDRKGKKFRLCGLNSQLRSVLATTRLDRLFDITDTEAGAIQALRLSLPRSQKRRSDNRKIGSFLSPSIGRQYHVAVGGIATLGGGL